MSDTSASGSDFVHLIAEGRAFDVAPAGTIEAERGMSCGAGRQSVVPGAGRGAGRRRGLRIAALAGLLLLVLAVVAASLVANSRGVGLGELLSGTTKAEPAREIRGTFRFSTLDGPRQADFIHTDAYFDAPSSTYNPSLASMSCALALSAGGSAKDEAASAGATQLLADLGFEDIQANDGYDEEPSPSSIGAIAGRKKLAGSGREIAAVVVRGGGYRAEWASNMDVGADEEHEGFAGARDQVMRFLRSWQRQVGAEPEAFWVAGYSRGGAVAGLLAQALAQDGKAEAAAIYAYAFEPPASIKAPGTKMPSASASGSTKAAAGDAGAATAGQAPVWNLVNPADLVPRVPLAEWGFARPGTDVRIPGVGEDGYALAETAMRAQLAKIDPHAAYDVAAFGPKALTAGGDIVDADGTQTQERFLDTFTTWLAGKDGESHLIDASIPSSATYSIELQPGFMYLAEVFGEAGPSALARVQEAVMQDIAAHPFAYAKEGIAGVAGLGSYKELAQAYASAMDAEGIAYDRARLDEAVAELAGFLLAFALDNSEGLATLVGNVDLLLQAHSGQATLAWVRAGDPNYCAKPIEFAR